MNGNDQSVLLLDTNVVLYFLGGRLTTALPEGVYAVSVITEIELLSYPSLTSSEETQIRAFLAQISVIALEAAIKELTITFRKDYRLRLPDAVIAATAKHLTATLLTNDTRLIQLGDIKTQTVQIL